VTRLPARIFSIASDEAMIKEAYEEQVHGIKIGGKILNAVPLAEDKATRAKVIWH